VTDRWQGHADDPSGSGTEQQGPIISIRHPKWTSANPRQDIPIMVFTRAQWSAIQKEELLVGAGPVGPMELSHNRTYVFALPARFYDSVFPTDEVGQILSGKPLQGDCPGRGDHE
jgi:hypothetical protein